MTPRLIEPLFGSHAGIKVKQTSAKLSVMQLRGMQANSLLFFLSLYRRAFKIPTLAHWRGALVLPAELE